MIVSIIFSLIGFLLAAVCLGMAIKIHITTYRKATTKEQEVIWLAAEKWIREKSWVNNTRYDAKRTVAEYIANKKRLTLGMFNDD